MYTAATIGVSSSGSCSGNSSGNSSNGGDLGDSASLAGEIKQLYMAPGSVYHAGVWIWN